MSLLGALLLALVGTAMARTPTSFEESTITSLAGKTALEQNSITSLASKTEVKAASSLQSTLTPGLLTTGQVLPQVRPSCAHDPREPAVPCRCLGPVDPVFTEACKLVVHCCSGCQQLIVHVLRVMMSIRVVEATGCQP